MAQRQNIWNENHLSSERAQIFLNLSILEGVWRIAKASDFQAVMPANRVRTPLIPLEFSERYPCFFPYQRDWPITLMAASSR